MVELVGVGTRGLDRGVGKMANQVQIPVIQSATADLVQAQQNANKVLRNINNQLVSVQQDLSRTDILGEIKFASLTLAQFQATASTDWILANGQSSVGTSYAAFTGNNTVPNISVSGCTAFIKVN